MRSAWASDTARRLRLSGSVDFTTTRVGQTLHIPCVKGSHIADVTISPGMSPNGVAKAMLAKGWTIGSRLICPDCKPSKVKPEKTEMPELVAPKTLAPCAPPPSDAAKKAQRMVYMALEDYYDEPKKRYKTGYDDAKVAADTGAAIAFVTKTRDEFYGPLGEPSELLEVRQEFSDIRREMKGYDEAFSQRIAAAESKMNRVCIKHGWALL